MAILQLTRQTLTKSMPSIFDNKNSIWPDPEQSIGEECPSISGMRCWLPVGPALAAFEVLAKDLQDLLDKHKDALMQGESKPRAISFNMWMTGSKPESCSPTIVFSSKSPRQRLFAKALVKDSKLLDQYPGVRIKTVDRMPAIYQAGSQEPDTVETSRDSTENIPNNGSKEAIYMVDDSRGSCGALIAFGHMRLATMGGILLINGTYYGISAQHGRYEFLEEPEDSTNEGTSLCFDDDSDAEDSDLDNLIEITSKESISSYSDEGSSTLSFASTTSPKDRIFEFPINIPSTTELTLDHTPEVPSPSQPTYSSNPMISKLLPFERNDLDYEVFEIDDPRYHTSNKIDLPSSRHPIRRILPNKIARTLVECPVWAATGTTGCVQGTMMKQTHYIKMAGSETFQEMWAVKLDRNTKPGDSGAWVVDSDGQIYGHIVAGDPMLGLAFLIPAYKVFDDIERRFGSEALCCPSSSTMQPYNTPKNYLSSFDLSVGITQTWAPSRLVRWSDYQNLGPMYRTSLMTYLLLNILFYLPLADYGMVFIRLGGVGLVTYSTLQTAFEILSLPFHLPSANGSIMSVCLLQWVALVITYTRWIVLMRTYMSIQSGVEYPLAAIKIRDGHELQTGGIWSFTSLLSAFSASNSALYVASRALYGKTHLSQHEENARFWNCRHIPPPNLTQVLLTRLLQQMSGDNFLAYVDSRALHRKNHFSQHERNARFWNSRHITHPDLAQVLLTRLLQLMFWNDNSKWQRIARGGRHARTNMYLACWAEQNLQKLEQEVLHRRAGFCRGDLLSTSMINTGTSKQLMAAAFDATVFSAKTPFGSMVPSICSYTYIGYNLETAADAAADRIDVVHKTVNQPPVMIIGTSVNDDTHHSRLSYLWRSIPATTCLSSRRFSEEGAWSHFSVLCPRIVIARPFGRIDTIEESIDLRERFRTWLDVRRPRSRREDNQFFVSNIMDYIEYISDDSDPTNFQGFLLKNGLLDLWENQILWDDEELMSGRIGLRFRRRIYQLRCYACGFLHFCGHGSIALPVPDARQLRRRRLNAPRRREDNSQCSGSRERERQ